MDYLRSIGEWLPLIIAALVIAVAYFARYVVERLEKKLADADYIAAKYQFCADQVTRAGLKIRKSDGMIVCATCGLINCGPCGDSNPLAGQTLRQYVDSI